MRTQDSALPGRPVQLEGNVVGIDSVRPLDHKRPEWILTDDAMKLVEPCFFEMRGTYIGAPNLNLRDAGIAVQSSGQVRQWNFTATPFCFVCFTRLGRLSTLCWH